jgi:hypothetical protein
MLRNLVRAAVLSASLFVLGAISASAAFASGEFTVGLTPAAITGEQTTQNVLEVTNTAGGFVKVKCNVATFEGTTVFNSGTDLTITPTYSGCTLGGLAATVRMNGCKYTLTAVASHLADVDIVGCTTGKAMTIVKGNCTISVPAQNSLSSVSLANEGAAFTMDVVANFNLSFITVTQTGTECPSPGSHSFINRYTGSVTLKAFIDQGSREVIKHEHLYAEVICGIQVSFTVD